MEWDISASSQRRQTILSQTAKEEKKKSLTKFADDNEVNVVPIFKAALLQYP